MSSLQQKPDTDKVLSGLKDFQRRTVEYVFKRMYLDKDATRRFLIADEAGLGKTMVAKGLIAKVIDHLWKKDNHRIDVIYICSNADIARQNIRRLNVSGVDLFKMPDRITLLPQSIKHLESNRLNFVAFTPNTSMNLKFEGRVDERALLYRLLKKPWGLRGKAPKYVLQGYASYERFEWECARYASGGHAIDKSLERAFLDELDKQVRQQLDKGEPDLKSRFMALCRIYCRSDARVCDADSRNRRELIGELRGLLASVCLEALEPDLIIMDEFQRFRNLLQAEDDAGVLAHNLFNYAEHDGANPARVLLLSATPYKLYTMNHEAGEEDHYIDFMRTVDFLNGSNSGDSSSLRALLKDCGSEYFRPENMNLEKLTDLKQRLEANLRSVMVRTEKLSCSDEQNAMLKYMQAPADMLTPKDVMAFLKYKELSEYLEEHSPLEFWRSAPYLFNFMDDYRLKRRFMDAADGHSRQDFRESLRQSRDTLLRWADIRSYREIDPANAKLRALLRDTVHRGMWKMLWLPPALPYYRLEGVYEGAEQEDFSKRLLFSCWHVVPKVVSSLASYEVERLAARHDHDKPKNTAKDRKGRRPLLRFAWSNDRLTGLPVLGLVYPAVRLAEVTDPLRIRQSLSNTDSTSLQDIMASAEAQVERALSKLKVQEDLSGAEDQKWYWAAPILLDAERYPEEQDGWLHAKRNLAEAWKWSSSEREDDDEHGRWGDHVGEVYSLMKAYRDGKLILGRRPADLAAVLTLMGIGGPGCCSLRALTRRCSAISRRAPAIRDAAGSLAFSMLSQFNSPEAISVVQSKDRDVYYWQAVLVYACAGCLQSVLDEYIAVLHDAVGTAGASEEERAVEHAAEAASAITFRTGRTSLDNIRLSGNHVLVKRENMRVRFALRFGAQSSESGGRASREDQVRAAFNSPFWPFIVASTSIGQEGLDFHQYCHAVVHWNLPSNPVDLEQREGRVHRYKGHAVRKNLAREFGRFVWSGGTSCPWATMFSEAHGSRPEHSNDIYPFWILPSEGGAKIERHVLALPLSREERRLQELRKTLVAYRMVFGQSRQEDILEYMLQHVPESDLRAIADSLRINLEPI